MAKEKSQIVIKKVIAGGGGHHGGSWKVALADFMTAMMAFFLVMWLLGQSEEQKKAIADYFSTPSLIEYTFQNYGAEITLEKLFLDFVNEPLKAVQDFVQPMDKTPDLLDMGSAAVVTAALADQLSDSAKNVSVTPEGYSFDIPDYLLFQRGTAQPATTFIDVMERLKAVTTGLEDAEVRVTSGLFVETVPGANKDLAKNVAQERLDIITQRIKAGLEKPSVSVEGFTSVIEDKEHRDPIKLVGLVKFQIVMKENPDAKPRRKLEKAFGKSDPSMNVYDNFVKQLSESKAKRKSEEQ